MQRLYRLNIVPFAAMIIALVFCIPLLGNNKTAKVTAEHAPPKAVEPVKDTVALQLEASGLVDVENLGSDFAVDQRYGTVNNFTGAVIYRSRRVYLRPGTAQKLVEANKELGTLGYKIKIWDAYRPMSVQNILYAKVPANQKYFIANPTRPNSCTHNRGAAVDVTLVHLDGTPVEMPTDFDTFDSRADTHDPRCGEQAAANRDKLHTVMEKHGFSGIECEWWHFNDTETYKYGIIDVMF